MKIGWNSTREWTDEDERKRIDYLRSEVKKWKSRGKGQYAIAQWEKEIAEYDARQA